MKLEKKYKGATCLFTSLDEYDEENEGLEIKEYEWCEIIGLEIDQDNFEDSYWNIRFEDGKEFYGIPGCVLELE